MRLRGSSGGGLVAHTLALASGLLLLLAVVGGIGYYIADNTDRATSLEDAMGVLKEAEARAKAGDVTGLCRLGLSEEMFAGSLDGRDGLAAVPDQLPKVVRQCVVPSSKDRRGGRLLVLEGRDGAGKRFTTEFFVWRAGLKGPIAIDPVYWTGSRYNPGRGGVITTADPDAC